MIKIKELIFSINLIDGEKKITFGSGTNLIYSDKNSMGKTTLIRVVLWCLGFEIPSSKGIDFNYIKFSLTVQNYQDKEIVIKSDDDNNIILIADGEQKRLPKDGWRSVVISVVFGIDDAVMQNNLLGAFYIDQEQGWNVANRGKVVGRNMFSIEDVLLSLSKSNAKEIDNQISRLNEEIKGYKGLLSMSQSAVELGRKENEPEMEDAAGLIRTRLYELRVRKKYCLDRLQALNSALKDTEFIKELIDGYHLSVKLDDGKSILVTSERIEGLDDHSLLIQTRRDILRHELGKYKEEEEILKRDLERIEDREQRESYLHYCMTKIRSIEIRQETVKDIVVHLRYRRRVCNTQKRNLMSEDVMEKMSASMCSYLEQLVPRHIYSRLKQQILTSEFAPFSGAERSKRVLAFKMTYIKIIRDFYGVKLPIIVDSPFAKEMDMDNYNRFMKILRRDFSEHQIIIASIHEKLERPYYKIDLSQGLLDGNAICCEMGVN